MVVLLGCDEATQPESAGAAFMMPGSSMTAPNATGSMDAEAYPAQNVTDAAMTLDRDSGEDRVHGSWPHRVFRGRCLR